MSAVNSILANLPVEQIAARLGADPAAVRQAAGTALPALLGGLRSNAASPAGQESLTRALADHQDSLADGPVDLDRIDTGDGEKITRHIFGDAKEAQVSQLASGGASKELVAKLLPILAPIVLSYLAKQTKGGSLGGGALGTILGEVLGGAAQGAGPTRSSSGGIGGLLAKVLGGLFKRR